MARLFGYYRSSSAYRVRIALALKGLEVEHVPVNLKPGVDGQNSNDYKALNPQGRVPLYEEEGFSVAQSVAIIEYLEESTPSPALLPSDPRDRAMVRQLVNIIAADVQPLNNLSVLKFLKGDLSVGEAGVKAWYDHWIHVGFDAFEALLQTQGKMGKFCFGDTPGMADVFLIPQVYNVHRFKIALTQYPRILAVAAVAAEHPAFIAAAPENQEDAP